MAQAQALGSQVPEVDRLAVRMVTDNVIIQFVPSEKREGLAIERKGGNQTPMRRRALLSMANGGSPCTRSHGAATNCAIS
jgi:hypothetical protein